MTGLLTKTGTAEGKQNSGGNDEAHMLRDWQIVWLLLAGVRSPNITSRILSVALRRQNNLMRLFKVSTREANRFPRVLPSRRH
jgi:hypothetical protein